MTTLLSATLLLVVSSIAAVCLAATSMRSWTLRLHLVGFITLLCLLAIVNDWMPFAGGGDDYNYFRMANLVHGWSGVTSVNVFSDYFTQPGYTILLNAVGLLGLSSFIALKALNLTFFLLSICVWTRIVYEIEGIAVARKFSLYGVVLTPLWFYFLFLLKDLVIIFLFSIIILSIVKCWKNPHNAWYWLLQILSIVMLIPFRAPLVVQAIGVLGMSFAIRTMGRGKLGSKIITLVIVGGFSALLLLIVTDPRLYHAFGIYTKSDILGAGSMAQRATTMHQDATISAWKFPIVYLFSETSVFNPNTWQHGGPEWLRGLLAVPWILFVVPMMPLALHWLMGRVSGDHLGSGFARVSRGFRSARLVATPWAVVIMFIAASFVVSWIVGDTTRWRLADMPAWLAVVVAARSSYRRKTLFNLTVLWDVMALSAFALYALV